MRGVTISGASLWGAVSDARQHLDRQLAVDPVPRVVERRVPERLAVLSVDEERRRLHGGELPDAEPEALGLEAERARRPVGLVEVDDRLGVEPLDRLRTQRRERVALGSPGGEGLQLGAEVLGRVGVLLHAALEHAGLLLLRVGNQLADEAGGMDGAERDQALRPVRVGHREVPGIEAAAVLADDGRPLLAEVVDDGGDVARDLRHRVVLDAGRLVALVGARASTSRPPGGAPRARPSGSASRTRGRRCCGRRSPAAPRRRCGRRC